MDKGVHLSMDKPIIMTKHASHTGTLLNSVKNGGEHSQENVSFWGWLTDN